MLRIIRPRELTSGAGGPRSISQLAAYKRSTVARHPSISASFAGRERASTSKPQAEADVEKDLLRDLFGPSWHGPEYENR
jgi:hypothetical protein